VILRGRLRVAVAASLLSSVAVLGACGGGGGGKPAAGGQASATGRWGQVHTGICKAAAAAADGDRKTAEQDFADVHAALHELAAAVEREDRAAAARLLQAKQRVEADPTADDLTTLSDTVRDGIRLTGGTAPDVCPR
jgi:hypothetical protein